MRKYVNKKDKTYYVVHESKWSYETQSKVVLHREDGYESKLSLNPYQLVDFEKKLRKSGFFIK